MANKRSQLQGTVHLLDMGYTRYGDCIYLDFGDITVLIDGGHAEDFEGQDGYSSIPEQLELITGKKAPHELTLLIVTHCHGDHIGCLPQLVANDIIRPEWALVADEKFGFGIGANEEDALENLSPTARSLVASMREEDHSDLNDSEIRKFLSDVAKLDQLYPQMLRTLKTKGTRVVRYGRDDHSKLVNAMKAVELDILGPSVDQLLICAEAISATKKDALSLVEDAIRSDADPVQAYKRMLREVEADNALDRPGKGAAINNQSIVASFGSGDFKILLSGDMQFAKPEVKGVAEHMTTLRKVVAGKGPYWFVKTSHHTSYNGIDETVYEDLGSPPLVGHSGGLNDAGHPDGGSLAFLKSKGREMKLARTDRNGLISLPIGGEFEKSRGRLNDFTPNGASDVEPAVVERHEAPREPQTNEPRTEQEQSASSGEDFIDIVYVRIPKSGGQISLNGIQIDVPGAPRGRVSASRESVEPERLRTNTPEPERRSASDQSLGGGRKLPKLLFVTNSAGLSRNVGEAEAKKAMHIVQGSGQDLIDIADQSQLKGAVRKKLKGGTYEGVVLLGGYDVVPSERVDVLDPALRTRIGVECRDDPDNFIVWSDDIYGDADGDQLPELPVSRIPDGASSRLLLACLTSPTTAQPGRFGIRNSERPFANTVWPLVHGQEALLVSGPCQPGQYTKPQVTRANLYFMLHGDSADGARFWGEDGGIVEAINVSCLPQDGIGTVMAGCCWGALTVTQTAAQAGNGRVAIKTPAQSMALSMLMSGANAFVGCTGAHYSPDEGAGFFGGPMHQAFWTEVGTGGRRAAEALFNAKRSYLQGMPHNMSKPFHLGIERKIYKQFTCLGLGW